MGTDLRWIRDDELAAYRDACHRGFLEAPRGDHLADAWNALDRERALAAFDAGEIVATARNFSLGVTLPGLAAVPMAGVSNVAVLATHRRQGLLRQMMTRLLDDAVERAEPLAGLTASEGAIYERFGFGVATRVLGIALRRREVAFRGTQPDLRIRMLEPDAAGPLAREVFERVRARRVGAVIRPDAWWESEWDDPRLGDRFDVVVDDGSAPVGFAMYHVRGRWSEGEAHYQLAVRELVAEHAAAEDALWRYVCGVDLVDTVRAWSVPDDLELPWTLEDARAVRPTSLRDFLWCRVLDAPRALAARTYGVEGSLVLAVHDPSRPRGEASGTFVLEGGPDGAACERAAPSAPADLELDVADLGSLVLGGAAPSLLARAGRVRELRSGAVEVADRMFAGDRHPCALTWF